MAASAQTAADQERGASLLEGFTGPIRAVRPSIFYLLGLLVVTAAMVLLPLLYLAVIAAIAYGIYLYASRVLPLLPEMSAGRSSLLMLIAATGPPLACVIVLFFMVKPLLAARRAASVGHLLHAEKEPLLFAYIARLCAVVGAPLPSEIRVDADVNASAGFRMGVLSLFRRRLVLNIGLPLVAGMDAVQFTGVLGHELGHFTQGGAMRLNGIVRAINAWLARLVYERDSWDDELVAHAARGERLFTRIVCLLALAAVWLTRKFFWLLMIAGNVISCALMRQMEYDADRHEARVVGTRGFISTMDGLLALSAASQLAGQELAEQYSEGVLPNDLVALIASRADGLSSEQLHEIREQIAARRARLFDTHPSDEKRLANLRDEPESGVFAVQAPAAVLFKELSHLSRTVTLQHYEKLLGREVYRTRLVASREVAGRHDAVERQKKAVAEFFQEAVAISRPLVISRDELRAKFDPRAVATELKAVRVRMQEAIRRMRELYGLYERREQAVTAALAARALLRAGLRIRPEEFGLSKATVAAADEAQTEAAASIDELAVRLRPYESVVCRRLTCALRLLNYAPLAQKLGDNTPAERDRLVDALNALYDCYPVALEVRREYAVLEYLLARVKSNSEHAGLNERIGRQMSRIHFQLTNLREALRHADYPFEHAEADTSIARYTIERVPAEHDWQGLYNAALSSMEKFFTLYLRTLGQLADITVRVEAALKFPPLRTTGRAPSRS